MSTNQIGRTIIILFGVGLGVLMGQYRTPELESVENKVIYRFLYGYAWARGVTLLAFDALNLFPLE